MKLPTTLRSPLLRPLLTPNPLFPASRTFSTHPPLHLPTRNRIYDPIRTPSSLHTHLLLTATSRTPLLTLWTTTSTPSSHHTSTLLLSLLSSEGAGESLGGVSYAEIELDSPTIGDLPERYGINSVPTLLAFDGRGEAQLERRVVDRRELGDRAFLKLWIEDEAGRGGRGGGGGGFGIGGMFGLGKGS